jgi:hypothetical protein
VSGMAVMSRLFFFRVFAGHPAARHFAFLRNVSVVLLKVIEF